MLPTETFADPCCSIASISFCSADCWNFNSPMLKGNSVQFYEGASKAGKGVPAYYVDVAARLVGWNVTLRRGGTKDGEPILHMKKAIRLLSLLGWDKGSKLKIKV